MSEREAAETRAHTLEELRCRVCGAEGFEPCRLERHMATLLGFSTYERRTFALDEIRRAALGDETKGTP